MKKIALAVLAVVAMGAQAADEGVYGGLTYNHAKASGNWSGSENAAGFFGGYRFGDIAGEVSRFQKTSNGTKYVFLDVAAIPHLNIAKDVDLIGKVGFRRSESSEPGAKNTGTALVVGGGVEYALMPQVSVRALVDYSKKSFGDSNAHLTTTTLGVAYKF